MRCLYEWLRCVLLGLECIRQSWGQLLRLPDHISLEFFQHRAVRHWWHYPSSVDYPDALPYATTHSVALHRSNCHPKPKPHTLPYYQPDHHPHTESNTNSNVKPNEFAHRHTNDLVSSCDLSQVPGVPFLSRLLLW